MAESEYGSGDIEIILDGETRWLKPTMKAIIELSRHQDGIRLALIGINNLKFDTYVHVIKLGLQLTSHGAVGLDEKVYNRGLSNLLTPCARYLVNLQNGGHPPEPEEDEDDTENPPI